MTKNTKIVLIVVGVILLLLCICSAGVVFFLARAGKSVSNEIDKQLQEEKKKLDETASTPTPTPKAIEGGKSYSDADEGFSLMYPKDWTADNEDTYGTLVMLYSPKESTTDSFTENVNIVSESAAGYSLSEYTAATLKSLKGAVKEISIVSETDTTLGGEKAHEVIYTGTSSGTSLKWKQVWAVHDGTAYIVTYTAKDSAFNTFKSDADNIIASFEYTN